MWRPDNWQNPNRKGEEPWAEYAIREVAYEAGADAGIEALAEWLGAYCLGGTPRRECGHCWREIINAVWGQYES